MSPAEKTVEALLGSQKNIDLKKLTESEKRLLISLVRKTPPPCGKKLSIYEELKENKPCHESISALGFLYRRIIDGFGELEINNQYIARFKKAREVKINIENSPSTGASSPQITIVIFSDFQCPHCKKMAGVLKKILQEHNDKVLVVFKHYPLTSIHPQAMEAAIAAQAAFPQGRFWEMHDRLFAIEGKITPEKIEEAAVSAGLDLERWKKDKNEPNTIEAVNRDREEGQKLNISGTPTVFINGIEFIEGTKYLEIHIEELLND